MKKTNNTFSVIFYLKKSKVQAGLAPIYARITVNGKRADISMKRSIDEKNWNSEKGLVKGSREEIRSLNLFLNQARSGIITIYQELFLKNEIITAEAIKKKFLGGDAKDFTLGQLVVYHNTNMKDVLTWGTMKNYSTTQKYIARFLKAEYDTSDILLDRLNYKFITDFEFFLRRYKPVDHQKPLSNNGVMKHIERLRKMINLAVKLEWLDKDPFVAYKQKFEKVERDFLTEKELQTIETRSFSIFRLEWVRDLFVFSCYTGLAYIDLMHLTPSNIIQLAEDEYWLQTTRQKTSNAVRVPLLPKPLEIIDKYKSNPRALAAGRLFPTISNQKLNSYLKEIADLCDIPKSLTFHIARHTFATTVTLTNGVPIESVSKMLGHSKISTTQVYARVIEKKLSEDMKLLKQKLIENQSRLPILS